MPWVRIDDQFSDHPKVRQVGPLGLAMQVAGLCYCNRYLTDGFIPRATVPLLLNLEGIAMHVRGGELIGGGEDATWQLVVEDLVNVGLWEEVEGGYVIHDYLEYQPSRAEVLLEREQKRDAGHKGGIASAQARAQAKSKQVLEQGPSTSQARAQAKSKPVPGPVPIHENSGADAPSPSKETTRGLRGPKINSDVITNLARAYAEATGLDFERVSQRTIADWAKDLLSIHEKGYTPEDVRACIGWIKSDSWWKDKEISVRKLRDSLPKWLAEGQPRARSPANGKPIVYSPAEIEMMDANQREAERRKNGGGEKHPVQPR